MTEERILNDMEIYNALADMNDTLENDLEPAIVRVRDTHKRSLERGFGGLETK